MADFNEGAIADYTEAIRLDPSNADAHYNRGIAKSAIGDKKGAKTDYLNAAKLYDKQGNNAKAIYATERSHIL